MGETRTWIRRSLPVAAIGLCAAVGPAPYKTPQEEILVGQLENGGRVLLVGSDAEAWGIRVEAPGTASVTQLQPVREDRHPDPSMPTTHAIGGAPKGVWIRYHPASSEARPGRRVSGARGHHPLRCRRRPTTIRGERHPAASLPCTDPAAGAQCPRAPLCRSHASGVNRDARHLPA